MGSIIIIMPGHADAVRLQNVILRSGLYSDIVIAALGAEVLHLAKERSASLVI